MIVDVDVETTGFQPFRGHQVFSVQFGRDDEPAGEEHVDIIWTPASAGTGPVTPDWQARVQAWLDLWREDEFGAVLYRAWNSKFDFHFLVQSLGVTLPPEELWLDGMVEAKLMDENSSAALKARSERLGFKTARDHEYAVKDWLTKERARRQRAAKNAIYDWLEAQGIPQKRNRLPQVPEGVGLPADLRYEPPNYSHVPRELMTPYAKQDIVLTRWTGEHYDTIFPEALNGVAELEQKTLGALYHMEKNGLPMDRPLARRALSASAVRLDRFERRVKDLVGKSNFNAASSQQVYKALADRDVELGFVNKTPAGNPSMDEESLSTIDAQGDELAGAILEFRAEQKMYGTYLLPMLERTKDKDGNPRESYIGDDDRIHTFYRQVGARTGRMSSADPNVQNWHRDDLRLRHLVRAPDGTVLVTVDMDQIEARIAAYFAGDGAWRQSFIDGVDLHTQTAELVGLTGRQRASGFESPRQQGKRFNYLVMYGGGVHAIGKFLLKDRAEARDMLDRFYDAYPELAELNRKIAYRLAQRGYIHTISGRRMRPDRPTNQVAYKFPNYLIQGSAADMVKQAMVEVHQAGIPLVGIYHDELLAEVTPEAANATLEVMVNALTNFPQIQERVPLGADGAVVERWSFAKNPDYVAPYEQEEVAA